ncbi:MAG TPA: T9SS type A sorting domain-containing protein [Chitinophagaceae bacterium]|nr:T9SS type A sorting domain-containing protein [Chitinophagaceae bacterium]
MRKALPFLFPALIFPAIVAAQVLEGRVRAESGNYLAGAYVHFTTQENKAVSGRDGRFRIPATKLPDTLVLAAPGFEPYRVVITDKHLSDPHFEVVLLNNRELREVLVTAPVASKSAGFESPSTVFGYSTTLSETTGGIRIRGSSTVPLTAKIAAPDRFVFSDTNIAPRTGVLAKSRILTAGEVNDFNKWKMWQDYTESEFRGSSHFWGLRPLHRFSVQITGEKKAAISNEHIYLLNQENGDTVWTSVTDNTGKAELWAGFFNDQRPSNFVIATRNGQRIEKPVEFQAGINLLSVAKACGPKPDVDIAFVVDATGSMGDEIEFLKLELEDVIQNIRDRYSSLRLRAASVFYRDYADDYLVKTSAFNGDLLKTMNFIRLQSSGGGGDYPEAVDVALANAIDSLEWNANAGTRLLFLILDAPPHSVARERMHSLIRRAAMLGIRVVPIACSGVDKSTEFLLRSIALATNGTYAFLTDHSGVGLPHIQPTTDKYEVELLNALLKRIVSQYLFAQECDAAEPQDIRVPANLLEVRLYPNPTSGRFTLECKSVLKELFITDFTGKILMRLPVSEKQHRWEVDISRFPSGTYLVKYITPENKWGAGKVVLIQ